MSNLPRNMKILLLLVLIRGLLGQRYKIVSILQPDQQQSVQYFEDAINTINRNQDITLSRVQLDTDEDDYKVICNGLSKGFDVILDFTWSGNDVLKNLTSNMSLPYLHVDVSNSVFLDLLDAYLDKRNATDVLIIFDKEEYIDQSIYHWIDSTRLRMMIAKPIDTKTASKIKKIRPTPTSYAIIASTSNMGKLVKQIQSEDLMELSDRWNLVFTDFQVDNFDRTSISNTSVSMMYLKNDICRNMIQSDLCSNNFNMQNSFLYWMAQGLEKIGKKMLNKNILSPTGYKCGDEFPEDVKRRFDEILDVMMEDNNKVMSFGDERSIRVNGEGVIEKVTNGSVEVIATFEGGALELERQKQFEPIKAFYRIGITHAIPWSYKEKDPETGDYYWTGYCAEFAQRVSELMDFDYEFVEPEHGTFGEKVNGTWDGVVGDLARGNTDMAITAIIMTADKEEVIDFVAPYYEQTGISIIMRKPVRKTSLFKFMTVLKLEVWFSIIGALTLTGFMIWFLDRYSPYSARNNKKAYPYPCREFSLKESFWFALTSFTPQGGGEAPKALSGRTLVAAYWLFVVLMLATFTANLAAFLTVERMQAPVQSLEQLARQSRINYTVVKDSETHKYFINMKFAEDTLYRMWKELTLNASTDDTRFRVWDYPIREQYGHILLAINDSNPVANASEGFQITNEHLEADFAFIHDSSEVKYEVARNCNFTEVGEVFAEKPYAVAVQQGSHLQDDLSKIILDLQKDRFFDALQAKYWNSSLKGECPNTDENEGITLESLGGVFIATLFGLTLAMITLGFEVYYYKRKAKEGSNQVQIGKLMQKPGKLDMVPSTIEKFDIGKTITIGSTFKPVDLKRNYSREIETVNLSNISMFPKARNRITRVD